MAQIPDSDDELGPANPPGASSTQVPQMPQMPQNPFSPVANSPAGSPSAQELTAMLAQMTNMTQAAVRAAEASTQAVTQLAAHVASQGEGRGRDRSDALESKDLLRLLPKPEPFTTEKGEDEHSKWLSWWWQVRHYLVAVDPRFGADLSVVEANLNREVVLRTQHPDLCHHVFTFAWQSTSDSEAG